MKDREIDEILKQAAQVPHEVDPALLDRVVGSVQQTMSPVRPLPPAGVLVGGLKRLRSHGGDLSLVCTQARILKILEMNANSITIEWLAEMHAFATTLSRDTTDVQRHAVSLEREWGNGKGTLSKAKITRDVATLKEYLKSPRTRVPGTKMIFSGLPKDEDIDNVIAYLKQFGADGKKS